MVLISGHDGGTGASPLTSIKHGGVPWELGLAETQQVLVLNKLRDRIVVQVDGQLKTGRDVVIAALLGAEEFGFATAPLVVMGCIMMRVCHLNTCPVGIATQDPELRKRFAGKPETSSDFFRFVAEEVRELMAELGFRTMDEMIGRVDRLDVARRGRPLEGAGASTSRAILYRPAVAPRWPIRRVERPGPRARALARRTTLDAALPAGARARHAGRRCACPSATSTARWARSSATRSRARYGADGLPDDTIRIHFTGSAGQSFGAFVPRGITLDLEGDANDYVGQGALGRQDRRLPARESTFVPEDNIIVGNVGLYGATSGEAYVRGVAGERFAVRNSGATPWSRASATTAAST